MTKWSKAWLAAALLACTVTSCRGKERRQELVPLGFRAPPVDSIDKEELAEGDEIAFGLPIPRDMDIEAQFPDSVQAIGKVSLEALANYVRDRVQAERIDTGPAKTVFVGATLKKDAAKKIRVEVSSVAGSRVELLVRDRTRSKPAAGLSPAQRWQSAGVGKDGRELDKREE